MKFLHSSFFTLLFIVENIWPRPHTHCPGEVTVQYRVVAECGVTDRVFWFCSLERGEARGRDQGRVTRQFPRMIQMIQ